VTVPSQPLGAAVPRDSSGLVAGGAAAAALAAIAAADQFLVAHGELGADMLQKLGPLLGPVWGNGPLLLLLVGLAWAAGRRWSAGQAARAVEAAEATAATLALSGKVGDVAAGLAGLRTEVHELRGALQVHADATDARLRSHDAGLSAVQVELSGVRTRVELLERPAPRRRPR